MKGFIRRPRNDLEVRMKVQESQRMIQIRSGSEMIAEGALRAGCSFFAGYPITPASGIYETMMRRLPKHAGGGIAISAPDEISALAYCVGASLRGVKAMTATSGPGWALMIETVQYAVMTETPVVIAVVQRLGPSTGGATQGAQGDILLTEFVTSGGYTIPIFCPSNPLECFELTVLAFSWSERLRTPVILLTDKETAMTYESIDLGELHDLSALERQVFEPEEGNGEKIQARFQTYGFSEAQDVPEFSPVGGPWKVTATGSMHDKSGRLRKNTDESIEVLHHLQRKIVVHAEELALVKSDIERGAPTLVLSYGVTARTAHEAVLRARKEGLKVSWLNVLSLFPIPERKIRSSLDGAQKVIIPEENLTGQYRSVIQYLLNDREVVGVNRVGRMITPEEILSEIL
jgi:2-oxoglutarate ferredoxin oxidoreductase subunit alpha